MFAVAFEVFPSENGYQRYLDIAAALRPKLDLIDGFISVERFRGLTHPGWLLSLSLWRDEAALVRWRSDGEHHAAQAEGRQSVFNDYRIRVLRMVDALAAEDGPLVCLREYPDAIAPSSEKRFQSLSDPAKELAMADFITTAQVRTWQENRAVQPVTAVRTLCGVVLRDYGLFARNRAPQFFPDAPKR